MAASAGSIRFIGLTSRTNYVVDIYQPDAVGGAILFAQGGTVAGTASDNSIRFNEPVYIDDVSIVTGATAVGIYWRANGGTVNGSMMRTTSFLNTNPNRPKPMIGFAAGTTITAVNF
jgi:hypothetical protein